MIIYAANNQNSISSDLQSLNEFNEKIETYFTGKDEQNFHLYFERLRGQHSNITPPYSKINIETLARIYISVLLQMPHKIKSAALTTMKKFQEEGKIFNSAKHEANQYYYCGVLWYWFNYFVFNNAIKMNSKAMDMHILMACDIILEKAKKCDDIDKKLEFLNDATNTKELFIETVNLLNSKKYLFEKRGFSNSKKTKKLIEEIE